MIKIKLDENIPLRVKVHLTDVGFDVDTVPQEELNGCPDDQVWQAAQNAGRFLITQDLDFSDIHRFAPGTHHGILVIRLRQSGRDALTRRLSQIFLNEDVQSWQRCFVVATDRKIRVRYPESK